MRERLRIWEESEKREKCKRENERVRESKRVRE
jgi:hypothetical protein